MPDKQTEPGKAPLLHHHRDLLPERRRRISATPTRRSRPTPSRASCGSTATTSFSSPAPTSTARRSSRPRRKEGLTPRELLERNVPRFQAMVERMNCSNDDFIRTTEERHHRSSEAIWRADGEERRHLSRQICRLVFGARRGLLRRGRDASERAEGARLAPRPARRSNGWRRRAISSGCPPIRTSCSTSTQRAGFRAAEGAAQRGRELRARRPAGPVDLAHHLRLGHPRARQPQAHHVCVGRRADQLHHRASAFPTPRARNSSATGRPTCT